MGVCKVDSTNHMDGSAKSLSTARETIDPDDGTIVITFQNNRDLAPVLGAGNYMPMWTAGFGVTALLAAILGRAAYRRRKLKLLLEGNE